MFATVPVSAASRKPLLKLWLLIFAVVVGCLLLYGLKDRVAWAQRADEPEAYALLIVEKQDSRFPFDKQEKESDTDFDRYLHAQVVNLKNRSTLNRALNNAHVTAKLPSVKDNSDDLTWLEKNLGVTIVENTSILRVSLRGGNPDDNAAIVKGVIDAYLEETADEEGTQRKNRLKLLNDMAAKCERDLSEQRRRRQDIARVSSTSHPSSIKMARQFLKEDLDAYRKEHLRIKMALTTAKCTYDEKLKFLARANGQGLQKPDRAEQISQLKEEIPVLQELEKHLISEKNILEQHVNDLPIDSPDVLSSPSIDIEEQILKRVETARLELEMEMQARVPRVRILQSAIVAKAK
jgi:hypothetical protein